jgi:ERF superfamily
MHRSSETIGAIAGALAKAQAELINPEKSLTATLPSLSPGEEDRIFRYAPLSSGLEIVRKCLGHHEIAAMQTTAIDYEAGLIRLTTVLAHSSGEWVSSDWPVCAVNDIAVPHRMGAALTYARRYALFTLVGITGEDDIDAPDLLAPSEAKSRGAFTSGANPKGNGQAGSGCTAPSRRPPAPRSATAALNPEESAQFRACFLAELSALGTADQLAEWAQRILPLKNTMTSEDAASIEEAFRSKMTANEPELASEHSVDEPETKADRPHHSLAVPEEKFQREKRSRRTEVDNGHRESDHLMESLPPSPSNEPVLPMPVDKSMLTLNEPRRYRNRAHLEFVAAQPCLICERRPSDAHHLRFAQLSALGRRVSDEFTVPLCRSHHRALHRRGNEAEWWKENGIDPIGIAQKLWGETRFGKMAANSSVPF